MCKACQGECAHSWNLNGRCTECGATEPHEPSLSDWAEDVAAHNREVRASADRAARPPRG